MSDRDDLVDEELRDLHRVLADSHAFWEEPIEGDTGASGEEWLFDPELLVLDDDATKIWSHADLSALWERLMGCRLTDLIAEIGASPSTSEGHRAGAHGEAEEWATWSVRGLLESPRPPLEILRILKEEAKRIGKRADIDHNEPPQSTDDLCAALWGRDRVGTGPVQPSDQPRLGRNRTSSGGTLDPSILDRRSLSRNP